MLLLLTTAILVPMVVGGFVLGLWIVSVLPYNCVCWVARRDACANCRCPQARCFILLLWSSLLCWIWFVISPLIQSEQKHTRNIAEDPVFVRFTGTISGILIFDNLGTISGWHYNGHQLYLPHHQQIDNYGCGRRITSSCHAGWTFVGTFVADA